MEEYIGRFLLPEEVVHHINGDKNNNQISNLMIFPNNTAHFAYHRKEGKK